MYKVWGLGFGVWGFGFRVWGFGFRVSGFGFRVSGLECRVQGSAFRVFCFLGSRLLTAVHPQPETPYPKLETRAALEQHTLTCCRTLWYYTFRSTLLPFKPYM